MMLTGCVLHLESAKNCLRRQKKREKGKEKEQDKGETVYKINESEPSEYLRQLCLECGKCFFTELQS